MSYFKVGEECILQSKGNPELNGDCIVTRVLDDEPRKIHLYNGETRIEGGCAYFTTIKNIEGYAWAESALRKKHKPSTESLTTMIEELNKVKV
jgi:hypothetical protein